jgi:uncharacterized membrane protein
MSNYTISIQEMIDLGIPVFSSEIELIASNHFDDNFTESKWEKFKTRFIQKYKYREIGFEIVELFYDYFIDTFEDNIDKFKALWSVVIDDILSNNINNLKTEIINADLPFSPLQDVEDYASNKSTNILKSSGIINSSQMEQLMKYNKNYQDIDNQFLMLFNDLFMGVYKV